MCLKPKVVNLQDRRLKVSSQKSWRRSSGGGSHAAGRSGVGAQPAAQPRNIEKIRLKPCVSVGRPFNRPVKSVSELSDVGLACKNRWASPQPKGCVPDFRWFCRTSCRRLHATALSYVTRNLEHTPAKDGQPTEDYQQGSPVNHH